MTDLPGHDDRFDTGPALAARHGIAAPRGQSPPPGSRGGRFGRMFGYLPAADHGPCALDELASFLENFKEIDVGNDKIPAGYTYLGQFIDHDITFDPTSKLQRDNDPHALVNFRTPRVDLDSLYGSGPADQPYLYDWSNEAVAGVTLLVGDNAAVPHAAPRDLPRNAQGRAIIGDARNDENLIVSQLHLLFIRFHNKVVEHVRRCSPQLTGADLFEASQRLVRWHYQWIVAHDFLPTIIGAARAERLLRPTERRHFAAQDKPRIPVEFSGAAFRFGHSMVRDDYRINAGASRVPLFENDASRPGRHLGGFRRLPELLKIDWRRFFRHKDDTGPKLASNLINPSLAIPLRHLPPDDVSLIRLNLQRGRALGLPSGRDVATAIGVTPIDDDALFRPGDSTHTIEPAALAALRAAPPLWYYVLREAQHEPHNGGQHLGPVGGRIVAEVLVGLLEADPQSYLRRWPAWTPTLPCANANFTMLDLLDFTDGPQATPASPP